MTARPSPVEEDGGVVVGLDNGGTSNNATVLDGAGHFLVDRLVELPSRVLDGPAAALDALELALDHVLARQELSRSEVRAVGLGTPGPASADGVISSKGSTNFPLPEWRGFDVRTALEDRLGIPVVYSNDGNAAALYAHSVHFGPAARDRSSVAAVVGTGLGGGIVASGRIMRGTAGMAGELGHVQIPLEGLLAQGQPVPRCGCGLLGDAESVASLTGVERNLLPYWLSRYPDHPLTRLGSAKDTARAVRSHAEAGDELALEVFRQQAMALGRLFTIVSNVLDPDAYFVGGGVVETTPAFRDWFLGQVREHTGLRTEQAAAAEFALVPDRDMAGARGAAIAAAAALSPAQAADPPR